MKLLEEQGLIEVAHVTRNNLPRTYFRLSPLVSKWNKEGDALVSEWNKPCATLEQGTFQSETSQSEQNKNKIKNEVPETGCSPEIGEQDAPHSPETGNAPPAAIADQGKSPDNPSIPPNPPSSPHPRAAQSRGPRTKIAPPPYPGDDKPADIHAQKVAEVWKDRHREGRGRGLMAPMKFRQKFEARLVRERKRRIAAGMAQEAA